MLVRSLPISWKSANGMTAKPGWSIFFTMSRIWFATPRGNGADNKSRMAASTPATAPRRNHCNAMMMWGPGENPYTAPSIHKLELPLTEHSVLRKILELNFLIHSPSERFLKNRTNLQELIPILPASKFTAVSHKILTKSPCIQVKNLTTCL